MPNNPNYLLREVDRCFFCVAPSFEWLVGPLTADEPPPNDAFFRSCSQVSTLFIFRERAISSTESPSPSAIFFSQVGARRTRPNTKPKLHTGIDLLFADVPENLHVPNISASSSDIPQWNKRSSSHFDVLFALQIVSLVV